MVLFSGSPYSFVVITAAADAKASGRKPRQRRQLMGKRVTRADGSAPRDKKVAGPAGALGAFDPSAPDPTESATEHASDVVEQ